MGGSPRWKFWPSIVARIRTRVDLLSDAPQGGRIAWVLGEGESLGRLVEGELALFD
jgi:hypothetical protein